MTGAVSLSDVAELSGFAAANPNFDLITADLLHPAKLDDLNWDGSDRRHAVPLLRRWQRVARIEPHLGSASALLERGFDSAHGITSLARTEFVRRVAPDLPGGRAQAGRIYDAATTAKSRANHLAANVHALVGSPHFRSMNVNHVDDALGDYFEDIASYRELLGTVDYCECAECGSVLGPAAYLVDLLRIVDMAITVPNPGIPQGLRLDDRRPDIATLPLTCANTNDEVPYLQIVNAALEAKVAEYLKVTGSDAVYQALARMFYPSGLPFNLPLARVRRYLATRHVSLAEIYSVFTLDGAIGTEEARERLRLTAEQMTYLAPPDADHLQGSVDAGYGLPVTESDLQGLDHLDTFVDQTGLDISDIESLLLQDLGPQEVLDTTGSYTVSGGKGTPLALTQDGADVIGTYAGGGSLQGTLDGLVLRGIWTEGQGNAQTTGGFALTFDQGGAGFTGTWNSGPRGKGPGGTWNGTRVTDSAHPPTGGLIPHSLFINHVLGARTYLRLAPNNTDPKHPYTQIVGQALATLDTVNRFVRLATALGWSWSNLDWTFSTLRPPTVDANGNITSAAELDTGTLTDLAKVVELVEGHGIPLELATTLWFDLKTTGRGAGPESLAMFDRVFNSGSVLAQSAGRATYRPAIDPKGKTSFPNPLYHDGVLSWQVGTSTASSASAGGLVVAAIPGAASTVQAIAAALFGAGATVDLTVPNLSALYRHVALAAQLGLSPGDYMDLSWLLRLAEWAALPPSGRGSRPERGSLMSLLTPDHTLNLVRTVDWISSSGLRVPDVVYVVTGLGAPSVTAGYEPSALPAFLAALAQVMKPALATAATFESPLVPAPAAAAILEALVNQGFVDPYGVVVKDPSKTTADLSGIVAYAPAVGTLSAGQIEDAIARLATARAEQEAHLASQLGSLFGVAPDTAIVLAAGVAHWQRANDPVAPFVSTPLFSEPAASVIANGMLDPSLVQNAFADKQHPLGGTPAIVPLSVTSWTVTGQLNGNHVSFTAVTDDGAVLMFYEGRTPIFDAAGSDVLKAGQLDPDLVTKAFANLKPPRTLTGTAVASAVQPSAWTVTDPVSGVNYGARQLGGSGADVWFATPSAAGASAPAEVAGFAEAISRATVLMSGLSLTAAAMAALFAAPAAFGIADDGKTPLSFTFESIRDARSYARLRAQFGDSGDALAAYLSAASPDIAALAAVTGWDPLAAADLCKTLFGAGQTCATTDRVTRMARIFTMAESLGVDTYALEAVYNARAATASGTDWTTLTAIADGLLQARAAGTPQDQRKTTLLALDAPLLGARRDALVAVAIWKLGQDFTDIMTPRNLYEYLLLDVEMAGCAEISPIREALNAVQLYLQRCRLNLERNVVISTDNLPDAWWEWLLDYRVWEANRQVFLYPENYIDPSLRPSRTQLFQDLQNGLLQGPITDDAVSDAFHKYLDGFSEIARLVPIDSYHAIVHDAEKGEIDTLFVFSRTATQPYKFYLASRQRVANCEGKSGDVWTEWLPIDITINSPYVTPVYVFNRLYVLWAELQRKKDDDGSQSPTGRYPITQASVRLSYRSLSGEWMQPQTILSEQVVDVDAPGIYGPFAGLYDDPGTLWWNKVAAVAVPGTAPGSSPGSMDKLCVYYGPLLDPHNPDKTAPVKPNPNPDALEFFETIQQGKTMGDQVAALGPYARVPINPTLVLDANLGPTSLGYEGEYLMVQPDRRGLTNPPTFRPVLNGSTLAVLPDRQSIYNEYVGGSSIPDNRVLARGAAVANTSFESDLVSVGNSALYYQALSTFPNTYIDGSGHVDPTKTPKLTAALLYTIIRGVPETTEAISREIRERLLTAVYGTPQLFGAARTQSARVSPTRNQPGMFLFANGSETFLVEAGTSDSSFAMTDAAVALATPFEALTPQSFVSRDITLEASRNFYSILADAQTGYIDANGRVVVSKVQEATPEILAAILSIQDVGRAQEVRATLLSAAGPAGVSYAASGFKEDETVHSLQFGVTRLSTSAVEPLERALYAGGIDALLALPRQQLPVNPALPFSALGPSTAKLPDGSAPLLVPPVTAFGDQVEFDGPFGLYYWELFFHAPFLVANVLRDDQQFQAAEKWFQYIFNPTLPPDPLTETRFADPGVLPDDIDPSKASTIYKALVPTWIDANGNVTASALTVDPSAIATATGVTPEQATELKNLLVNRYLVKPRTGRYWQFEPFRNQTLESLKDQLQNCAEIAAYNDDPFDPHAIARLRIGAYEKSIVMAYIGNLLDWGDQEFTQYTWESVTTARMLYTYAYDLLGHRPVDLGQCQAQPPVNFADIRARYAGEAGGIPQFLIDMENALGAGQALGPMLTSAGKAYNDLGATFCVPENDQLLGLWTRVEDRLYKIHNCMNIAGQVEPLALWDAPISALELVRAGAGGGFAGLQAQLQRSVPNYRFSVMIGRAEELAESVRSFGSALLTALERRDAEGLSLVRASQEVGVLGMVTATKQAAITDLEDQLSALQQGLASANYRVDYYSNLLSAGLNAAETADLVLASASLYERAGAIPFHGLSIAGFLAPNIFGFADGGMKFGDAIGAGASIATTISEMLGQSATIAQTVGQNQRRAEEWQLAKQTAQYEADQLTEQIAANTERIAAARQDLAINAQEIANATRVESLLRTNFTNQDLYTWMTGRIATVYFQAFRLAQDMALAAQTAYRFELDRDDTFVAFANWDNLHQGLLAGESLLLSLKQMKKAYLDADSRLLEIEKTVSMRQNFPEAFAGFRWGNSGGDALAPAGRLDFTLSEALFDFDYPSHYDRKIKSVSVSVPSVIGPYQDFHLTLTQNTNLVVLQPDVAAVDYAIARTAVTPPDRIPAPPAGSVRENWAPSQSIAVSRGVDDSGLFLLDFHDERYLPFEGTGAVSSWTLSLPPETNRIDFDNISDVILKVRYTARDGGSAFAAQVKRLYGQSGDRYASLNAVVYNLASAFSAQWSALVAPPIEGTRTISFPVSKSAILPNLGAATLRAVLVQLELDDASAVTSPVGKAFLHLQVGGKPSPALDIPVTNNFGELNADAVSGAGITTGFSGVQWSLAFDSGSALDMTKLQDVALAVVYSARPFAAP
jgi:Tc toxin complex TcA C-terminal TcB-binding domain/Neuraminidase-like domain/Salmonella virulence plasmid 28.1kDa A protein